MATVTKVIGMSNAAIISNGDGTFRFEGNVISEEPIMTALPEAEGTSTPLTDAAIKKFVTGITITQPREEQFHDFARTLERKLNLAVEALRFAKNFSMLRADRGDVWPSQLTNTINKALATIEQEG